MKNKTKEVVLIIPNERIMNKIFFIRGKKVMLDSDLAELYGVSTGNLNKAVKRNLDRFPDDFMFKLSKKEFDSLMFQNGISKEGRGGTRKLPSVFTEQGVAMLSSVLKSKRAVQVNIQIMRMFIRIREFLASNSELRAKVELLEKKYDTKFKIVFDAIKSLMEEKEEIGKKETNTRKIGFEAND